MYWVCGCVFVCVGAVVVGLTQGLMSSKCQSNSDMPELWAKKKSDRLWIAEDEG